MRPFDGNLYDSLIFDTGDTKPVRRGNDYHKAQYELARPSGKNPSGGKQ